MGASDNLYRPDHAECPNCRKLLAKVRTLRRDLVFLDQARARQRERNLRIEDGWLYFIHGWTRVIAEVFRASLPVQGPVFDELSAIAARVRG